jgi:hypothetical protein
MQIPSIQEDSDNSLYDLKGKRIGLKRVTQAEWIPSLHELEKGWLDSAFDVKLNLILAPEMAGQAQWLSSSRRSVTEKLPDLPYYRELEALNHATPGAVSIIH